MKPARKPGGRTPSGGARARVKDDQSSQYAHVARFALARALWESPAQRPRALTLAREAKAGYQRLGNLASEVAKVDGWLQAHGRP